MNWLNEHKTKLLGIATALVATLLSMIALGMFNADANSPALLDPLTQRWMTILLSLLNVALGGGTYAAGVSNSSKVRIAEAKAEVAGAIETALNMPPPAKGG